MWWYVIWAPWSTLLMPANHYKISKAWQLLWMTLESQDQSRCTTVLLWPKSRFLRVVAGWGLVLHVAQVNRVLVRSRRDSPAVGAVLHHFDSPCSAAVPSDPLQRRRVVDAEISPNKPHLRMHLWKSQSGSIIGRIEERRSPEQQRNK